MNSNHTEIAAKLLQSSQAAFTQLKQSAYAGQEALFSGLFGFAGIQLGLWPCWLEACRLAGQPLPPSLQALSLTDAQQTDAPWLCLSVPMGGQVILVHIQAPGVGQNRKLLAEIQKPGLYQLLRTLDETGKAVAYSKGAESLYQLGYSFSADKPLEIPRSKLKELQQQWPLWQQAAATWQPLLNPCAAAAVSQGAQAAELAGLFAQLAAALWQAAQNSGLIQCGQAKGGLLARLGFGKQKSGFSGCLILYGDHEAFWNQVQYRETVAGGNN